MDNDEEIIEVYHAGTEVIEKPDCKKGRKNLDFGQGFYLTDIYDQALNFARDRGRNRKLQPIINVYILQKERLIKEAKSLIFPKYDESWLEFIVSCRGGKKVWTPYDYVEGGVADDRVIDTVNFYLQGFISKKEAIKRLKYLKPNNQICILNQYLIDKYLEFKTGLILPKDGLL